MKLVNNNLSDRFLNLSIEVIKLAERLPSTSIGKHITLQWVRSVTSSGANYQEACGAQSRTDFIHKMHLVFKELHESDFWLKIVSRVPLIKNAHDECFNLSRETNELINIIAKSLLTAKKNHE